MRKAVDLSGKRFGRLVITKWVRPHGRGTHSRYKYLCDCGKTGEVGIGNVGATRSCGCLKRDELKARFAALRKDLTGQTFGKWTVIREGSYRHNNRFWICKCSCGSVKEVSNQHLKNGNSTQCIKCSGKANTARSVTKRKTPSGKWLYGVSGLQETYWKSARSEQFEKQQGICPVCDKPLPDDPTEWAWDHDHLTGECRDLLHRGCNVFIGRLENDPDIVNRSLGYLQQHRSRSCPELPSVSSQDTEPQNLTILTCSGVV